MIGGGSLLPIQAEERERGSMSNKPICGDHLQDDCVCFDYLKEITTSAERLIQLAKERKELSK
jgi:hypothetical protein